MKIILDNLKFWSYGINMFNSYGDCINPVYLELRKIYCCRGAAFCGPELEKAWKEIERLEKEIQKLKGKKKYNENHTYTSRRRSS